MLASLKLLKMRCQQSSFLKKKEYAAGRKEETKKHLPRIQPLEISIGNFFLWKQRLVFLFLRNKGPSLVIFCFLFIIWTLISLRKIVIPAVTGRKIKKDCRGDDASANIFN